MLTQAQLLQGWEGGAGQAPVARAVALAAAAGGHSFAEAGDLPLGARDALLVGLRGACFRGDVECLADCPGCGQELEVSVPLSDLRRPADAGQGPGEGELTVRGRRVRFRALTSRDVLAVAPGGSASPDARRRLVGRCVLAVDGKAVDGEAVGGWAPEGAELTDEVIAAVAAALPSVDPGADIRLDLTCALCGHAWAAPFDVPAHVWADVDACARGLLADVHVLARAYGWREEDILALSAARRRFYLEATGT
ncbi:hypothetical protein ACFWBF_13225 [Streptomyces sp. NPDC060028]|uniref:hypothetical protein n=1 Tax=Streptomyces sp. NPDC060028 TaxID=3347041 RepID=UPI0036AB47F7